MTTAPAPEVLVPSPVEWTGDAVGVVDTPSPGGAVRAPGVQVTGWVRFPLGPVESVRVSVTWPDGRGRTVSARPYVPRPDVAALEGSTGFFTGFSAWVPVREDRPAHERGALEVVARSADGAEWRTEPRSFVLAASPMAPSGQRRAAADALRGPARWRRGDPSRVFVATHHLGLGGGQLYLHELLRGLVHGHGMTATVAAPEDGLLADDLTRWGCEVAEVGPYPVNDVDRYVAFVRHLAWRMRRSGAGSVLVNTLGAMPAAEAARVAGLPAVWAVHESFDLGHYSAIVAPPSGGPAALRSRWPVALRSAAAVVFEAHATRELFAGHTRRGRGVVIPYGVDTSSFPDPGTATRRAPRLRATLGLPVAADVLVSVGTFEQRKGQALLVEAFAQVAADHPNAVLVLVGRTDDAYSRALERRVSERDLADRIRLVPLTPDLDPWYAAADVFISVSDVESMPRTMLEAMGHGLPVLSTGVFGVPELVRDGRDGWLFEADSLGSLMEALDRVLSLPAEERDAAGRSASQRVHECYDSAGYVTAFARLLPGLATDPDVLPGDLLGSSGRPGA
ncbi:MAG: glycosyltransferase family 4 protein [Candidatus Nanopelagicales bacterium]